MTTGQIKNLCGDIMIYLDKAVEEGLPENSKANMDAAKEIVAFIYENPPQAMECSESLYKIISGLHELCFYYELSAETPLDLAKRFTSRLYDDVREMRP